jgi:hypothetical protein
MEPTFGYHPNLTLSADVGRHGMDQSDGVVSDVYGAVDNSPKYLGALVLGSLVTLVALKALGFRFSFGVSGGR